MFDLFQQIIDSLAGLPPHLVYLVIGLLAAVENVFPPLPADAGIALGAFLSHGGTISATTVFLVTWLSNVVSASLVYVAARRFGRDFFRGTLGQRLIKPRHFARLEKLYRDHGSWGIFASRFVPGARAVVSPFAGIAGLSAPRVLLPVVAASGIWYGTLTFIAARAASELDAVLIFLSRFNTVAIILTTGLSVVAIVAWRKKKKNRE